jgi:hypothetical protein
VRECDVFEPRAAGEEEDGGERIAQLAVLPLTYVAPATQDVLQTAGSLLQQLPSEQMAEQE